MNPTWISSTSRKVNRWLRMAKTAKYGKRKNFRFKSLKVPVIVHLGTYISNMILKNFEKEGNLLKMMLQNHVLCRNHKFCLRKESWLFSIRNWLLKVFLLNPNGGYFVNYINGLSKIINGREKWQFWHKWN